MGSKGDWQMKGRPSTTWDNEVEDLLKIKGLPWKQKRESSKRKECLESNGEIKMEMIECTRYYMVVFGYL